MALEELNISENRKRASRRGTRAAVAVLNKGYTREADLRIFRHVTGLPEYEQAGTLFCLVGANSGIDVAPILEDALRGGKRMGAPRCISRGIMEIREIRSLRGLEAGKCGMVEPGVRIPAMQAERISLAIVPRMPCSHDGRQLGYSGGYYDRYLGRARAVKAVMRRERIIRADIPVEPRDQMMGVAISEKGVRRLVDQRSGAYSAGRDKLFHIICHRPAKSSL